MISKFLIFFKLLYFKFYLQELKAQFELHNHIRNECSGHFDTALKIVPVADENLQRQFHTQLQERWQQLAALIEKLQTTVTNNYAGMFNLF